MKFTIFTLTILALALPGAVAFSQNNAKKPDPNVVAGTETQARLDQINNWVDLFNGKDLTGWTGDTEKYVVEDGNLICTAGAKNLITEKEYADFVFEFEFKLTESGNNGIGIRVPEGGRPSADGMEIQILDHRGKKYNSMSEDGKRKLTWLKPWQMHGSIYGVVPAKTGYLKPLDQWNRETIICIDDHVKVILNGAVIVDAFLDDIRAADGSFHKGTQSRKGHIMLAGHSDHVEFRKLRIAEFNPAPPKPASNTDNTPPAGFAALFNGKDLTGWKGLAHKNALERYKLHGDALAAAQAAADEIMNAHWSVKDGVLTYDGKGQSLCTAKDYGDFEMYVDWKIPPGADSGIYLRGTPQIQIWDPWDPRTKDKPQPANPEEWVAAYRNGRNLGSGGLWNNRRHSNRPLTLADKKPGEWNTFYIRMVGDKVTIFLNEKLIVDRTKLENFWDREGNRTAPLPRADQIELQHHGSALYFKNLYIRELPY
ncbi:MAG: DUF1080 domain-containing protein [Verrucomicrobiales bacterium]|nr:DUF1080 domain-containing protein [Verrucomicrobiales bacterium]